MKSGRIDVIHDDMIRAMVDVDEGENNIYLSHWSELCLSWSCPFLSTNEGFLNVNKLLSHDIHMTNTCLELEKEAAQQKKTDLSFTSMK